MGTFGPTRDNCSVYPCETQSQWGRRAVRGGHFRGGQTSGPLRPATVKLHTFCFLPKTYLQSQIQNQKIQGHTEHSPLSGAGRKKGMLLPPQHPIPTPESLKSFTATRDVLGIQLRQRKNQTPSYREQEVSSNSSWRRGWGKGRRRKKRRRESASLDSAQPVQPAGSSGTHRLLQDSETSAQTCSPPGSNGGR